MTQLFIGFFIIALILAFPYMGVFIVMGLFAIIAISMLLSE
jgi:hypothetical protein